MSQVKGPLKTKLARAMRKRFNLISETCHPAGLHGQPKGIEVAYWQGQTIVETVGVGKTMAEAIRNCDFQGQAFLTY